MKKCIATFLVSWLSVTSGCLVEGREDTVSIHSRTQGVSLLNSMSYNRLDLNRLVYNRLTFNRLALNRLTFNRLTFNSLDGLETSADGRELLQYIARCALAEGDTLVAEHDGREYEFPGLLEIAPAWEHRGLLRDEERLLSACLIAHVNAYGASVPISLRFPGVLGVEDGDEVFDYPVYEATFFGNVFGDELETYGCIGDAPEVAAAHSPDRELRVCSDPGDDCEVVSLGRCRDVCETRTRKYGWQDCWANGRRYAETVSVYLHDPDTDRQNRTCGIGGRCKYKVSGAGVLDCSEAAVCRQTCKNDSVCTLDGTSAGEFRAEVKRGSVAEINCHEAYECAATCKIGSTCEIDCKDANECRDRIRCQSGAECLLDCTGAVNCGFRECQGGLQSCPGDIVVCNRGCP